ncbi:MAG: hypothetical protein MMC33_009002 [Icmadophila ericetorum]|nr:hypothetical protein [Icmadophila ericetorum]
MVELPTRDRKSRASAKTLVHTPDQPDRMGMGDNVGPELSQIAEEVLNTPPVSALTSTPNRRLDSSEVHSQDHSNVVSLLSDLNLNSASRVSNEAKDVRSFAEAPLRSSSDIELSIEINQSTHRTKPKFQLGLTEIKCRNTPKTQRFKNSLFKSSSLVGSEKSTGKQVNFSKYLYKPTGNCVKKDAVHNHSREETSTSKYFRPPTTSDRQIAARSDCHHNPKEPISPGSPTEVVHSMFGAQNRGRRDTSQVGNDDFPMPQSTRRRLFDAEMAARTPRDNYPDQPKLSAADSIAKKHLEASRSAHVHTKTKLKKATTAYKPVASKAKQTENKANIPTPTTAQDAAARKNKTNRPDTSTCRQGNYWSRTSAVADSGVEIFIPESVAGSVNDLQDQASAEVNDGMDWLNDYHDDTILPSIETDPDSLGLVEAWREQVSRLKFEDSTSQATTDLARRRRSSLAATGITTKVKSTSDPLMQTFSRRPSRAIRKITQRANDVNIRYTPNRSDKHASNGRRGGFQAKMFITDSQDAQRIPESQIFRPSLPLAVEPGLVDISEEEGGRETAP